jgi:glutathione reductase (NADPH)
VEVTGADGTKVFTANHVAIAVGGQPSVPDVPGADLGISSDGFFELEEQPKKCGVFGAGYIAVEMAGILNALGTETTLFCRGNKVLRNEQVFDTDIVDTLLGEMEKHGPVVRPGSDVKQLIKEEDGSITIELKDDSRHTGYDCVLWAIGRHPVTSGIGLDTCGVEMSRGFVKVDEHENTNVPGIYALGDCTTTGWELTPVAIAAGRRLADRLFGGEPAAKFIYKDVPTVIFSHPPIGTIGYTEAAAKAAFGEEMITTKKSTFASMGYSFNDGAEHKVKTTLKLVLWGPQELILGLHMVGPSSDEMLQGFAVAVKMGATRADLEATCAIHPTIGEEMVTFSGWGQGPDGRPKLPPAPTPAKQRAMAFLEGRASAQ